MKFETKAIRLQGERSQHREHSAAIHATSSFVYDSAEQMQRVFNKEEDGNIYSRFSNPSVTEFQDKLAALEGTEACMATASGMAAIFASFMAILQKGDHIISSRSIFGSSYQILKETLPSYGIETNFVDGGKPSTWESVLRSNTKMMFLETPSNPGLALVDLKAASDFCKQHDLILNVDNCFATPYLQNPAVFGADLITHSATKFIDGQGRVVGGAVCGKKELVDKVFMFIRRTGASMSPFNAWILSKSLETLSVRMDRHCDNALKLSKELQNRKGLSKVNYPFLESHPDYNLAKKQMSQGGGIVTFELEDGMDAAIKFLNRIKILSRTANIGDVRSIASHPASTTHLKVPAEDKKLLGITGGLIRISVGLEHIDDILEDIDQAIG